MATWGSLLEFCPSNAPTLQYKPARASTLSYSAIDAPGEAQFLRQSNADSLEQDFVSRIISAFREELSQRGLLDSSLPEAVLNAMGILDNTIGTAVLRTEEETWIMLGYWVAAVRAILRAMLNRDDEVLHQSTPKNVFSQIGDCDLTIVKKGQEDPLKSISIQCRIPAALATHSEELAQPHTFKPEMQTNGRAMLVKLDLQVEHNSPAHVGIIFDGLRATFVEHCLYLDHLFMSRMNSFCYSDFGPRHTA
ncbi:hypothetical protein BT96DRAFT_10218 [Gymnopus androsaceus JB14]|uniref:Uncharacterized protein n=1 Tax=Gymnopus androsaceus JB14 TaxID=1447944 RepID=A0A6A4INR7_9AGAR|nr:hypothetical protein BT96DRAFT_10218 [Gymnopus androsaceus JB14]